MEIWRRIIIALGILIEIMSAAEVIYLGALQKEADHYMRLANELYSISELNEEMVGAFIERINLYDQDHIEIIYKFTDLMRNIVTELEEEEETA